MVATSEVCWAAIFVPGDPSRASKESRKGQRSEVVEVLILPRHRPDELVVAGSRTGMDGPRRRKHRLPVTNDEVPCLLRPAH